MFDDPQIKHLSISQPLATKPFGDTNALGQPVILERTPSKLSGSPPERGEHTLEILREIGIEGNQAEVLKKNNII